MSTHRISCTAFAVCLLCCAACGNDGAAGDGSGRTTVFAAASLTEAFGEIGDAFSAANPDAEVTFNFAASSELATQILQGAPADVYASADPDNMVKLIDAGDTAGEPQVFTTNRSAIVVEHGNPLGISGVADLSEPDLIVVTCAPEVPCGSYAATVFDRAGVDVTPDSYEENVKAVVTKVALGEADAGIAYTTDVIAAGEAVDGVEIPAGLDTVAEYPIAVTASAPNPAGGRAFVEFVVGTTGQSILADHGFTSP